MVLRGFLAGFALASAAEKVPQQLPLPTSSQLSWQSNGIMALIHFNMATFFKNGDPGCDGSNWDKSQHPSSFAPSSLNVSQ